MSSANRHPSNALVRETSPYLQQHAHNPVNWLPWGQQALRRARREDKPILLSVGYSACHWCHVMAHESFEDEETAALMNRLFVNIKVDREERPDIDKIYQLAHQLLTRRPGGWPLTMFLSPERQVPFFGGTYFPHRERFGMPAFCDVLTRVAKFYETNRAAIEEQDERVVAALQRAEQPQAPPSSVTINGSPLEQSRILLEQSFDPDHGGFGQAPKFPHPTNLERLLRCYAASVRNGTADERALHMATFTLRKMSLGGMYDQLGGGFCRYSVDEQWMIPHFEKMLYDNGSLLQLAARARQLTGDALFERIARETADWVIRDMQSPQGGYYSTLDADTEGKEGKFYVWTPAEVHSLLSGEEYRLFAPRFGLDRAPNFEDEAWHLHVFEDLVELANSSDISLREASFHIDKARAKLLGARNRRVWPGRDEKVLTSWNALMIKAMSVAGRICGNPAYQHSAERALDFLLDTLWVDGRLLATYKDGKAHLAAYLDDYAFLLDALLHMLSVRWRQGDLSVAQRIADVLLEQFEDQDHGGFFFTASDHEQLLCRSKSFADDALPAGNGVAALALNRLGHLLGELRYTEAATRACRAAWPAIEQLPHAHNAMLEAVEEQLEPPQTIVLRGSGELLAQWHDRCCKAYSPGRMAYAIPDDALGLSGLLFERAPRGSACAYVCEGYHCEAPIDDVERLDELLARSEVPPPSRAV